MKRCFPHRGFTLVEMLMVMLIIAVLAALTLSLANFINRQSAMKKAEGEINGWKAAAENYRTDHGSYPRMANTTEGTVSPINPKTMGDPTQSAYKLASQYFYGQLAGDLDFNGVTDAGATAYYPFKPNQLGHNSGDQTTVAFLQDPFGNSYGYSTSAATDEDSYQQALKTNPAAVRTEPQGFNTTSFDLWSTGGGTTNPPSPDGTRVWARWQKNW